MRGRGETGFERFFRRLPKQSRSFALVDALIGAVEAQLTRADHPEGWTLEALVDQAGVGIGSFYEYFSSKDSLLGAFVGHLNARNFATLLVHLDERHYPTLEQTVEHVAGAIADIYLGSPKATRVVIETVGRLSLLGPIHTERDRFALELVKRARPFLPDAREEELVRTMQLVADGAMGVLIGDLMRRGDPDRARSAAELTAVSLAVIRARHPETRESVSDGG